MSELQGLQLSLDEFRKAGVAVMALSTDSVEDCRGVVERLGLQFPLLSDPELRAIDAFGLRDPGGNPDGGDVARPATFALDGGTIRWRDLTDNWRIRPRAPDVLAAALASTR